jgi:hypothetical protein
MRKPGDPHPASFWAEEDAGDIGALLGGADFSNWKRAVARKAPPPGEAAAAKAGQPVIVTNGRRLNNLSILLKKVFKRGPPSADKILRSLLDDRYEEETLGALAAFLPSDEKGNTESANILGLGGLGSQVLQDPVDRMVYTMASNPQFRYMVEIRRSKGDIDESAELFRAKYSALHRLLQAVHDSAALKQMLRITLHAVNQVKGQQKRFATFTDLTGLSALKNEQESLLLALLRAIPAEHPIHGLPATLGLAKAYTAESDLIELAAETAALGKRIAELEAAQRDADQEARAAFAHVLDTAKAALGVAAEQRAAAEAMAKRIASLYSIPGNDAGLPTEVSRVGKFLADMEVAETVLARERADAARAARAGKGASQGKEPAGPVLAASSSSGPGLRSSGRAGSLRGPSHSSLNPPARPARPPRIQA